MGFAVKVYEAFKDDEVKAKVLAEFIEKVEEAINNNQLATRQDLNVQELRLTKEIEQIRKDIKEVELKLTREIKEVELKLTKEIEQVRAELTKEIEQVRAELTKEIEQTRNEMREIELKLTKEIEQVRGEFRLEIEKVRVEMQQVKASILKWLIGLLLTQTITIIGVIIGLFQVFK